MKMSDVNDIYINKSVRKPYGMYFYLANYYYFFFFIYFFFAQQYSLSNNNLFEMWMRKINSF